MTNAALHPRPVPTPDHAEFWAACRRHQLRIQQCRDCRAFRFHPRPVCPECRSRAFDWTEVSGRATVHTYTICHPPVLPAFADDVPYNAVVVQLEEGPFMVSNLVDCANDDITVGMPVEVTFADIDDELTIPQFRPVGR
jgi:uncharacterized protein